MPCEKPNPGSREDPKLIGICPHEQWWWEADSPAETCPECDGGCEPAFFVPIPQKEADDTQAVTVKLTRLEARCLAGEYIELTLDGRDFLDIERSAQQKLRAALYAPRTAESEEA